MARAQVTHGLNHSELLHLLRSRPTHAAQVPEFEGTATLIVFTRADRVQVSGAVARAVKNVDMSADDYAFAVVRDITREATHLLRERGIQPLFDNAQGGAFWSDESYVRIRQNL